MAPDEVRQPDDGHRERGRPHERGDSDHRTDPMVRTRRFPYLPRFEGSHRRLTRESQSRTAIFEQIVGRKDDRCMRTPTTSATCIDASTQ
jgi:hypothetical protein